MLYNIFDLSDRVVLYEQPSDCGTVHYTIPFLKNMVAFLEHIRKRPFKCYVVCDEHSQDSMYRYVKEEKAGAVYLQIYKDPRYLVRLIAHELCHYTMDNQISFHHPSQTRRLSTFEEVFAELFSMYQIKEMIQWFHQMSNEQMYRLMQTYVAEEYTRHPESRKRLYLEGIGALPLFEENFLPQYENCCSVALFLLPHFEAMPELWNILPHIQEVDPRSSWTEFFDHLQKTADDSYRQPLERLIKSLFPCKNIVLSRRSSGG